MTSLIKSSLSECLVLSSLDSTTCCMINYTNYQRLKIDYTPTNCSGFCAFHVLKVVEINGKYVAPTCGCYVMKKERCAIDLNND